MALDYRLGLSSYAYYWAIQGCREEGIAPITPLELVDKTASLGLEVLQICDNLPLLACDKESLETLRDAARGQGITLELGSRGLDVDILQSYLRVATALGARILRVVPWSGLEQRQELPVSKLRDVIEQLLPRCRQNGIRLAIENYFDLADEELAAFVQEMDDEHVGVCLDTANSAGSLQKPLETVKVLARHAASVHLKDFVVTKVAMGYHISGVALGQGWLDAEAVLDVLSQTRQGFSVLLELWVDPAETFAATLAKEDDWVRQSAAYARQQLGIGVPRTSQTL